jgi:CHAD domain-containing protein
MASKWIRLKSKREPVYRVAARMLRSRLEEIVRYLPLAANKASENDEYVHQLRVWTRRADAAVDLCEALLTKGQRKRLAEQLDVLRDAAGAARDADVLRGRIASLRPGVAREHLFAAVDRRREDAQAPIVQACEELRGGGRLLSELKPIEKRLAKKRKHKPFSQTFRRWAEEQFAPLVKKFFRRGKHDLADLPQLHRFRIAGKRLRYALELVGDALPELHRKRASRALDRVQTQLGAINDLRNVVDEIEKALNATKRRNVQTALKRLLVAQRRSLAASLDSWLTTWKKKGRDRLHREFKNWL